MTLPFRFHRHKGLAAAFLFVTLIIVLLGSVSLSSLQQCRAAIQVVIDNNNLTHLVKDAVNNLTVAGQLGYTIERQTDDLNSLRQELDGKREAFRNLSSMIAGRKIDAQGARLAQKLSQHGERFYEALFGFIPLREKMLIYHTEYQGEVRPLFDFLSQRELDLIRYVRALKQSVVDQKALVETLDYQQCGFYRWQKENLPADSDLAEIITEEIDPLHRNLHAYAAQLTQLIRDEKPEQAASLLAAAEDDIGRLGIYFNGLRMLTREKQTTVQKQFDAQFSRLSVIYRETDMVARELEQHLEAQVLGPSLTVLATTLRHSSVIIWIFSLLGSTLSLLVAYLAFKRVKERTTALIMVNRELEQARNALGEAYEELKSTQAQILQSEKMASIGQLAAGVAHEINNPMGYITSNLNTLKRFVERLLEFIGIQGEALRNAGQDLEGILEQKRRLKIDVIREETRAVLSESLEGAERVTSIVQNLKNFSHVDEAQQQAVDLNVCLENTLNVVLNEFKHKIAITKEFGDLPRVVCWPQQINQLFMNLLINATQAIAGQGEIRLRTWSGHGFVYVEIEDTGSGIPDEIINRIFEPFFTTKEVGKGTGLGLAIAYDIVKKHDGSITVASEVGKGSTFVIRLPAGGSEASQESDAPHDRNLPDGNR